jgi:hypothetical protein
MLTAAKVPSQSRGARHMPRSQHFLRNQGTVDMNHKARTPSELPPQGIGCLLDQ